MVEANSRFPQRKFGAVTGRFLQGSYFHRQSLHHLNGKHSLRYSNEQSFLCTLLLQTSRLIDWRRPPTYLHGVELHTRLDHIDGGQSTMGDRTTDTSSSGTLQVVLSIVLFEIVQRRSEENRVGHGDENGFLLCDFFDGRRRPAMLASKRSLRARRSETYLASFFACLSTSWDDVD